MFEDLCGKIYKIYTRIMCQTFDTFEAIEMAAGNYFDDDSNKKVSCLDTLVHLHTTEKFMGSG